MLTLLIGTDWIANRKEILDRIAKDVAQQKGGRVLIVPELISHDTERRLAAIAGDTSSRFAEVLTFTRLAQRVADSVGHAAPECMDKGGRVVAMAAAARQLHSKLKAYASVETKPEFLSGLLDAVDEFKRCCISAEDLRKAAAATEGSLAQKLEELSLLLDTYDCLCQNGKRDPADRMNWVLDELYDGNFAQEHVFYVDGFPDLTRQHMAILVYLMSASENLTVSLNCDVPGSGKMAFEKAGQTAMELIRYAKEKEIPVQIVQVAPRYDALTPVRESLFQGELRPVEGDRLLVYQTETLRQECSAALQRVLELVQKGVRYRQIGIVCADIAQYKHVLDMLFRRCDIPLYISGTEDILDKSVVTTVLTALEAAINGFEKDDVIRYLKSAFAPIDFETSDELESYAVIWGVSGRKWLQKWENHPDGLGRKFTDGTARRLERLNAAREELVAPLVKLQEGFRTSLKVADQVKAIYAFLEDIGLAKRLQRMAEKMDEAGDNRSAQILNQLWDILLDAMEQLYDVLGQTAWDADTFCRLFKLLLSQYDVGTIPPALDAVTAGPVSAMRCLKVNHLIVLGAVEGAMPGYGGSTGVLTDLERVALRQMGVPLTGGAMEGLQAEFAEIYGVFCGATETVAVSCPGGQPSVVHRRLGKMCSGDCAPGVILGSALGNRKDAAALLARFAAEDQAKQLGLQSSYEQIRQKLEHSFGTVSREHIESLYGDHLRLSASQIDKQAECRMHYFLRYGLNAQERKTAQVDPAEFGTYVHDVLENTVNKVMELGGFKAVTEEQTLQIAMEFSAAYAESYFGGFDTERLAYLFRRNGTELSLIVRELWSELNAGAFAPVGCEVNFGEDGEVPPIDVSGQTMAAQLGGKVDRVDAWSDGNRNFFRVVDYKTGSKDFDYCDIYNGYGLQMLLYLFALENGGYVKVGNDGTPAGVQYFPARVPIMTADGVITDEEAEEARVKLWKRKGLLLSEEDVLNAMDDLQAVKRLPCRVKKDGTITGDIADRAHFAMLKTYVFALVRKMVDQIASGVVDPNPYTRGSSHDACAYCPYGAVCHKTLVTGRRNYKTITPEKFWEDVEGQVKQNG